jgi:hypothetical protein
MTWQPPSLTVKWGPYRRPDPEEQLQTIQAVQAAMGGTGAKLMTLRVAIEKLRGDGFLDVDNIDALIKELESEQAKADEKARQDAKNQLADAAAVDVERETKIARATGAQSKGPLPK